MRSAAGGALPPAAAEQHSRKLAADYSIDRACSMRTTPLQQAAPARPPAIEFSSKSPQPNQCSKAPNTRQRTDEHKTSESQRHASGRPRSTALGTATYENEASLQSDCTRQILRQATAIGRVLYNHLSRRQSFTPNKASCGTSRHQDCIRQCLSSRTALGEAERR